MASLCPSNTFARAGVWVQTKQSMGEMMRSSYLALAEAKFAMGDFTDTVMQQVDVGRAQVHVRVRKDNVAGVQLPIFEHGIDGSDTFQLTGTLPPPSLPPLSFTSLLLPSLLLLPSENENENENENEKWRIWRIETHVPLYTPDFNSLYLLIRRYRDCR